MIKRPLFSVCAFAIYLALTGNAPADDLTDWQDVRGESFQGTAVEALGPIAVFRTKKRDRPILMPFRLLGAEGAKKFHSIVGDHPLAPSWSEAKATLSSNAYVLLDKPTQQRIIRRQIPEPEVYLVISGLTWASQGNPSGNKLGNLRPFTDRMETVFPQRVATLVLLPRESQGDRSREKIPPGWYYVQPSKSKFWKTVDVSNRPGQTTFSIVTREGIPLVRHAIGGYADVREFNDAATSILWKTHPENLKSFPDRKFYTEIARPRSFAKGETDPLVLNSPFGLSTLRSLGVQKISARLSVDEQGNVVDTKLLPDSKMPSELAPGIAASFARSPIVLPAINNGQPVAGEVDFHLTVPATNPQTEADRNWLTFDAPVDIPLKQWLVLQPIKVDTTSAGSGYTVDDDGTVVMDSFVLNSTATKKQQLNSFNSNWFDAAGAASVQPRKGDEQYIDDEKLNWKAVNATAGFYDFRAGNKNVDNCLGYAWTEIDSPIAQDAWLGFASDDGVKVWFNGELVIDAFHNRPSRIDDDVVALKLRPGKNHLLLKIQNNKGQWSFFARLRTEKIK